MHIQARVEQHLENRRGREGEGNGQEVEKNVKKVEKVVVKVEEMEKRKKMEEET